MERKLLLTLRFCGTNYHGFQVQKNAVSVCEAFQDAVEQVFGQRLDVKGCSRTDTGVHALQYCLSMACDSQIPRHKAVYALNQHLPTDIAVLDCQDVPMDFHARYDCTGKEYIYKIYNSRIKDPFSPNLRYRYGYPLDERFLSEQAADFLGTHDYSSFASSGSDVADTVRTITGATVERDGEEVRFIVRGDGFLYNMVRIMAGTLLFIAMGRIEAGTIPDILAAKDRSRAGKTMPACGLYLSRVFYPDRPLGGDGKEHCLGWNGD